MIKVITVILRIAFACCIAVPAIKWTKYFGGIPLLFVVLGALAFLVFARPSVRSGVVVGVIIGAASYVLLIKEVATSLDGWHDFPGSPIYFLIAAFAGSVGGFLRTRYLENGAQQTSAP
jgi:hypothetical protein